MNPARVITTPAELDELAVNSIVCPPHRPDLARRKAWEGIFAEFGSGRESDPWQAWESLTDYAGGMLAVWVLWDAAAEPVLPAQSAYATFIPSRSPRRKAHMSLAHARTAVASRLRTAPAKEDMSILQLDPTSCQYVVLHSVPAGTELFGLPW
ncbi:hypothetical protein [Sinomonas atrocyanea]